MSPSGAASALVTGRSACGARLSSKPFVSRGKDRVDDADQAHGRDQPGEDERRAHPARGAGASEQRPGEPGEHRGQVDGLQVSGRDEGRVRRNLPDREQRHAFGREQETADADRQQDRR